MRIMKPQELNDAEWFAQTAKQQLETLERTRSAKARAGLETLRQRVRHDLMCMNFPAANWVPERQVEAPGLPAQRLLDALVIGAGMCGQTAAFALMRDGVRNLRIVDAAPRGAEGPWATFARMETLRSPKHLTGPDLGVPSLTYRAWYEAQHGDEGWEALYKVPRVEWQDYLGWVRDTVGIPVENQIQVRRIEPQGVHWKVTLRDLGKPGEPEETVLARKLVLALGRGGSGLPRHPVFPSLDLNRREVPRPPGVHHSSDPIDFAALRGKRVAILGAGSSAFDNAGTALEAGAAEVHMFMRRDVMPQVNKSKWTAFPGFLRGFHALDDDRKWAIYTYIFNEQVPAPFESVLRCDKHPQFKVRKGETWTDILPGPRVQSNVNQHAHPQGEAFDALIIATGFDVDLMENPLMTQHAPSIRIWADVVPAALIPGNEEAARFPYLGEAFEFTPKHPDSPMRASLANLHVFNWGCCMSHGAIAGDIPGLAIGATRLSQMIVRDIFVTEAEELQQRLYQHAELELAPTRFGLSPEDYARTATRPEPLPPFPAPDSRFKA